MMRSGDRNRSHREEFFPLKLLHRGDRFRDLDPHTMNEGGYITLDRNLNRINGQRKGSMSVVDQLQLTSTADWTSKAKTPPNVIDGR